MERERAEGVAEMQVDMAPRVLCERLHSRIHIFVCVCARGGAEVRGCGAQRIKDSLSAIHKAQMASAVDEHMRATETCAWRARAVVVAWCCVLSRVHTGTAFANVAREMRLPISCRTECVLTSGGVLRRRLQEQFREARSLMEEQRSLLEAKYAELQERFTNRYVVRRCWWPCVCVCASA